MSKYKNYGDVADSAEFAEYVKAKFGKNVSDIKDFEQQAIFYRYKEDIKDMDSADHSFIFQMQAESKKEDLDALAESRFPGKKFDDLSSEDKHYVVVLQYDASINNISLEEIKNFLATENSRLTGTEEHALTAKQLQELQEQFPNRDFRAAGTYENLTEAEQNHLIALGLEPKDNNQQKAPEGHALTAKQLQELQEQFPNRDFKTAGTYENLTEAEQNHLIALGLEPKDNNRQKAPEGHALTAKQLQELQEQFPNRDFRTAGMYENLTEDEQNHLIALGLDPKDNNQQKAPEGHALTAKQLQELQEQFPNRDFKTAGTYENLTEDEQNHLKALGLEPKDNNQQKAPEGHALTAKQLQELQEQFPNRDFKTAGTYENLTEDEQNHLIALGLEPKDNNQQKKDENTADDKENIAGGIIPPSDNKNVQQEKETEEYRLRSMYSDQNDFLLDMVRVDTLKDMNVVSDADIKNITPQKAIEILNDKMPGLSDKQLKEMESRMTDKMLDNEKLFALIPPSMLAQKYTELGAQIADEKDDAKRNALIGKKEKITDRIDELTEMLAKEGKTNDDLWFADTTNIADVHRGYLKMFEARGRDLMETAKNGTDDEKRAASDRLQQMYDGKQMLDAELKKYEEEWNLTGLKPENAEELDKRYEDITKKMSGVEIDEATAKLVSNFKFLDAEGKPEPQFVDDKGNKSDVYTPGAKVIEGSKLHTSIRLAKQSVMLENLGSKAEITPEFLQKEVCEQLPQTLYVLHVNSEVEKGVLENPKQYTDKKFLNAFINDLGNVEKPMSVSPTAYEAGVDYMVNATGGYAECLGEKIGPDKPVVTKVFEPIKDIDKRAAGRTQNNVSKKQVRIEMLKRAVKTAVSAFTVSAGLTGIGALAAADAHLTMATGGLNKFAGAALGVGLGVAMSIKQIRSWRKQQKKEGKPAGIKAFFKNRKMLMTIGTTALAGAAMGFAATGNPGVASALGGAALAVGSANGIISGYQDSRKAGLGKLESAGWGTLQAVVAVASAYAGRQAATGAINAYNEHNPDNKLFSEQKKIVETHKGEDTRVIDRDAMESNANRYNEQYNISDRVHPGLNHDGYMKAVEAYNQAHPDNPLINPDEALKHAYNAQNGRVYGPGYVAEHGLDPAVVDKVGHLIINDASGNPAINPEAVKAWNGSDLWKESGMDNFVKTVDSPVELRPDLYPDRNPESTYSNPNLPEKVIPGDVHNVTKIVTTHINPQGMVGMFGVMGNYLNMRKLKERAGALLDKVFKRNKKQTKEPLPPTPVPPQEEHKKKPVEQKKEPLIIDVKEEDNSKKMLMEEYKIVYGIKPEESDKSYQEYCKRVESERQASAPDKSMEAFLIGRREALDKVVLANIGENRVTEVGHISSDGLKTKADYMKCQNIDNRGGSAVIGEVRQSLMQSNLSSANYTEKMTLSHFTKYVPLCLDKDSKSSDGSRDVAQNPRLKNKYDKEGSQVTVTDLNAYLIGGKPLEQCQEQVSGKDFRAGRAGIRKEQNAPAPKSGGRS